MRSLAVCSTSSMTRSKSSSHPHATVNTAIVRGLTNQSIEISDAENTGWADTDMPRTDITPSDRFYCVACNQLARMQLSRNACNSLNRGKSAATIQKKALWDMITSPSINAALGVAPVEVTHVATF